MPMPMSQMYAGLHNSRRESPIEAVIDTEAFSPPYNSSYIIPDFNAQVPPPPAGEFIDSLQKKFPLPKNRNPYSVNNVIMPRTEAPDEFLEADNSELNQFVVQQDPKFYPGMQPKMPNVRRRDRSVPMREHFAVPKNQTCIDFLNHIKTCPLCQRYFQCDNKIYVLLILMLIVLFAVIIYFILRSRSGQII